MASRKSALNEEVSKAFATINNLSCHWSPLCVDRYAAMLRFSSHTQAGEQQFNFLFLSKSLFVRRKSTRQRFIVRRGPSKQSQAFMKHIAQ